MFPPGKSIAPRLAVRLVAVTSLVLAAVGAVTFLSQHHQQHRQLSEVAVTGANQLSAALSLPLWNFQSEVVNRILDSAMEVEDVTGIVVHQPNVASPGGTSEFARKRDARWLPVGGAPSSFDGQVVEKRNIIYEGKTIGSLELIVTPRWTDARLRSNLVIFIGIIILLDVVLVACLYGLLRREVITPLQVIGEFASLVTAKGGVSVRAQQPDSATRSEL